MLLTGQRTCDECLYLLYMYLCVYISVQLFTPSLQCAAMLVNVSLRRVMLAVQAVQDYRELEASGEEVDVTSGEKTKEETTKELEVWETNESIKLGLHAFAKTYCTCIVSLK